MAPETPNTGNRLLSALPQEVYQRLQRNLQTVALQRQQILYTPGSQLTDAYFPNAGVISIVAAMEDGDTVEVALVGSEGMIGLGALLGDEQANYQISAQAETTALRIPMEILKAEFERDEKLQRLLLRYAQARMLQIAQWAACNRLHTLEERLSHWLLLMQDRVGGDELLLTQEFIAAMLGTRRSTVAVEIGVLQQAGILASRRGVVTIRDREALESVACECHQVMQRNFQRLLG